MFDGCSKGTVGEVYSSDFGVVGQGIDDRLNSRGEVVACPVDMKNADYSVS
jgi:hypothetical protein